ncbi:MAG: hypothetical protein WBC22_12920 [Sedimentisphaerales bacterium]
MLTHAARFTSRLALFGVILFITVGTGLLARHRERIAASTSACSSKCAAILDMPNLLGPLGGEYRHDSANGRIQSNENVSNLKLCGDVFGTPTSSASPLENPESNVYDFDIPGTMVADSATGNIETDGLSSYLREEQETMTRIGAEQYSMGIDTTETPLGWNIEEASDTVGTDTPTEQVLTKIRTKMKSIETVLRKAVIKPYHNINGQIEGLQISGLDKVLVARDLLLKSGDIICVVNGQLLSSKKIAFTVFKKARELPIMEVELLRNGQTMTLQYYLR